MLNSSIKAAAIVAAATFLSAPSLFAQGARGAGAGSGTAGAASGMSGSAGTGDASTGIGASPGASFTNTVGQTNKAINPSNPSTTQPGGANAQPVPDVTVTNQNPQQFDPRLSPGYQK
jgi:hypothetical protein